MERVPQRVLNWLHSVLIGEYSDVNRTFTDVAQTLESYNSLRPSTDVYTFENGSSALLLRLTGTLPVSFRGGRYSFPVSIWIPKLYPNEGPIAFVTPTQEMAVRPGQHVSGDGRIYHPYLANWGPHSQILGLSQILQDVFSREPPVVAKQAGTSRSASVVTSPAPPRPPLPNELRRDPVERLQGGGPPPPPPPRPFEQRPSPMNNSSPIASRPVAQYPQPRTSFQPPLQAALPVWQQQQQQQHAPWNSPPSSQGIQSSTQPGSAMSQHQPNPQHIQAVTSHNPPQAIPSHPNAIQLTSPDQLLTPQPYSQQYNQQSVLQENRSQAPIQPKQPAMDLLTSPFDPPLPTQVQNLPAPVIPPNPEKNALLSAISHSLNTQLRSTISANESAIEPLSAQNTAMNNAMHNLQQERTALAQLQALLDSNEKILHQAMRDADECIASAQHKAIPAVDDVLVAPTVVGQQLYNLTADVGACVGTRDILSRALDRGRISSEIWIKSTRSLAREEFLKKVLIRRCAEGMGLHRGPTT